LEFSHGVHLACLQCILRFIFWGRHEKLPSAKCIAPFAGIPQRPHASNTGHSCCKFTRGTAYSCTSKDCGTTFDPLPSVTFGSFTGRVTAIITITAEYVASAISTAAKVWFPLASHRSGLADRSKKNEYSQRNPLERHSKKFRRVLIIKIRKLPGLKQFRLYNALSRVHVENRFRNPTTGPGYHPTPLLKIRDTGKVTLSMPAPVPRDSIPRQKSTSFGSI